METASSWRHDATRTFVVRQNMLAARTFVTSNTEVSETLPLCQNLLVPVRLLMELSAIRSKMKT